MVVKEILKDKEVILVMIKCLFRGIKLYLKTGVWQPHQYEEIGRRKGEIVITNKKGFRVSHNTVHDEDEEVHMNCTVITHVCKCCGHERVVWYQNR